MIFDESCSKGERESCDSRSIDDKRGKNEATYREEEEIGCCSLRLCCVVAMNSKRHLSQAIQYYPINPCSSAPIDGLVPSSGGPRPTGYVKSGSLTAKLGRSSMSRADNSTTVNAFVCCLLWLCCSFLNQQPKNEISCTLSVPVWSLDDGGTILSLTLWSQVTILVLGAGLALMSQLK